MRALLHGSLFVLWHRFARFMNDSAWPKVYPLPTWTSGITATWCGKCKAGALRQLDGLRPGRIRLIVVSIFHRLHDGRNRNRAAREKISDTVIPPRNQSL